MQKKIIALAVAAVASGAAFAQSNVTVYGVADLGQAYVAVSGTGSSQASVGRLDNNSSYIGFKGAEALGNGLTAVFQFETGVNADVGGFGSGRDTYIGLAGGFGTVAFGLLTPPSRAMGSKVELTPGAAGFGTTASITGTIAGTQTGADNRASNAVAYISPSFSGFSGVLAYVNGESRVSGAASNGVANARQWQAAAQYDNGPLFAGLIYHRTQDAGYAGGAFPAAVAADAGANASVVRAAVVYTLPSATKLTALIDSTKVDGANTFPDAKRLAWSVGAAQSFGKNTIGLEYARSGDVKLNGNAVADTKSSIATLVYSYELSKRTQLHARVSRLTNEASANTGFYLNPVAQGLTSVGGTDYTGAMVGVRHSF
ncbi:MAG: porin Gram-negative type [Proteobacteria bacterium]|nr:porin Gram-negative type [Pseudomonadota bacterium]